jgi:predicted SAM-dependent methyltransferase
MLEVGAVTHHQSEEFRRRGWITYTIDKNTCFNSTERRIVGDFETHEFNEKAKVNMVWMYHTLECFDKPKESLKKAFTVLKEDGILFIATPDTDFINTRSSAGFPHWKADQNHIMWNKRSLVSHLESLGFVIILCRSNYEIRFPYKDDFHLIAQKRFY